MITSASFIVTEKCNLACTYCFESKERNCRPDMSRKTAEDGLLFLFRNAGECGSKRVEVMLFGGEPLLRPDICEHILSEGYRLQKEYGVMFAANLITNATLLSDTAELMLYRWAAKLPGFTCQLSIDGAEESQNLYRIYPDGTGSFEAVEKNVEKFKNIFGDRLTFHGCINKKTLPHLFANYQLIADKWKGASIWFMPVHTENWEHSDVETYDRQLGFIFEDMKKKNTMSLYAPLNKLLSCRPGTERQGQRTCGAGITFVTITGDGDIYPCHNIYFNDAGGEMLCGNVREGITKPQVLEPFLACSPATLGCGECENTKCYRCIADNWVHCGDIDTQVGKPIRCLMSDAETKCQRLAREYADKHLRGHSGKDPAAVELQRRVESLQGNLFMLADILYRGLGGNLNESTN